LARFGVADALAEPMIERSRDPHRLGATHDNGSDDAVNASALAAASARFPATAQLPAASSGIRNFPPRPR
jgi:hypothetical protein